MGNVVHLATPAEQLTASWDAYDAAQLRANRLYADETSTPAQRRAAVEDALSRHIEFARLFRSQRGGA
jgi:hypothetical protein